MKKDQLLHLLHFKKVQALAQWKQKAQRRSKNLKRIFISYVIYI